MNTQPKPTGEWTVEKRITEYLAAGGLFNPELMEHEKVSDLLMDCRAALAAEHGRAENWKHNAESYEAELAAEREISAELAEQVHTAKQALILATDRSLQVVELKQQLSAVREKVQTLVDALKDQAEMTAYYNGKAKEHWRNYLTPKAKAALAKVEKVK